MKLAKFNLILGVFAGLAAVTFFCGGFRCWQEWRQFSERKTMLPPDGIGSTVEAYAPQQRELEKSNQLAKKRLADLQRTFGELQKKQMPINPATMRELQLELLELAHQCALNIHEISPVAESGHNLPSNDGEDTPPPGNSTVGNAGKQRPHVNVECHASFQQISRFFAGLGELKWMVTPVSFLVEQPNQVAADQDGEELGNIARSHGRFPDAGLLKMKVVLAF